jgi:Mn2+/Fe2+ NRAMP family transporter
VTLILGIIMAVAAEVLNPQGIVPAAAPQFGQMLEPLGGKVAVIIFGIGLLAAAITSLTGSPTMAGYAFTNGIGKLDKGFQSKVLKIVAIILIVGMGCFSIIPAATGVHFLNIFWLASFGTFIWLPMNGAFMLTFVRDKNLMGDLAFNKAKLIVCWVLYALIVGFTAYNFISGLF